MTQKRSLVSALVSLALYATNVSADLPEGRKQNLPSNYCSAYATSNAKELFSIDYPRGDAWNMRYSNSIVARSETGFTNNELKRLENAGRLKPGMLLGIENPTSRYRNHKDKTGNTVEYTHIALYLGEKDGAYYVTHQLGSKQIPKEPIEKILARGYKIEEILEKK
jgi:hypothetical protein